MFVINNPFTTYIVIKMCLKSRTGTKKKLFRGKIEENYETIHSFYLIGKQNRIGIFRQPEFLWGEIRKFLPDILMRTDADIKPAVKLWFENKTDAIIKYGHISRWNTKYVTNMRALFLFKDKFNEDISNWNTSNVEDMSGMFNGYGFRSHAFNQDISRWDVSKVRDMQLMFNHANNFNCDLSYWNVQNVRSMRYMFDGATNFSGNLSNWKLKNIRVMSNIKNIFVNCNIPENHKIKIKIIDSWNENDDCKCLSSDSDSSYVTIIDDYDLYGYCTEDEEYEEERRYGRW